MEWLAALLLIPFAVPTVLGFVNMCCCGASCDYFTDDFSTDRLSTDYTTSAGTFAVGSGVCSTTSADALITSDTTFPASQSTLHAAITITLGSTSDKGQLVFAFSDTNNYWFAEIVTLGGSGGTLKLFERSGGTNTQRGSTVSLSGLTAGTAVRVIACVYSGTVIVSATAGVSTNFVRYSATPTLTSTKCGFGTGSGSTSVTYDSFLLGIHASEEPDCYSCIECSCSRCSNASPGGAPCEVQVDIAGTTNGSCGTCSALNGAWILPAFDPNTSVNCSWRLSGMSCALGSLELVVRTVPSDQIACGYSFRQNLFIASNSPAEDCAAWDGFSLADQDVSNECDWTSATCEITAMPN